MIAVILAAALATGSLMTEPPAPGPLLECASCNHDSGPPPPMEFSSTLTFTRSTDQKTVFTIHADGSVEIGPGATTDEASRLFWEAVTKMAPIHTCKPAQAKP